MMSESTRQRGLRAWFIPALATTLMLFPAWWAFPRGLGLLRSWSILSGWLACGLLLASLLLMIREPRLDEWLGGLQRMYLWHHRTGLIAYLLLLTHPLALAASVWHESPSTAWAGISPWTGGAAVMTGWASLLLMMAGLAVTFTPRIPYTAWRRLHHLLSASIVAGAVHLLQLGLPPALLWVPTLAMLFLFWRFLRADRGLGALPYIVVGATRLAGATTEVRLRPLAHALQAREGQFVLAAFLDGGHYHGCREYHPFTVSSTDQDGAVVLAIKALGDCTKALQSVEAGVSVRLQGPFGTFLDREPEAPGLWIAGGIGITPFIAVLRRRTLRFPVRLLYLYRTHDEALYLDELEGLARENPLSRIERLETGDGTPDLRAILPAAQALHGVECYICGPMTMAATATALLRERGVVPGNIHFEQFDFR